MVFILFENSIGIEEYVTLYILSIMEIGSDFNLFIFLGEKYKVNLITGYISTP